MNARPLKLFVTGDPGCGKTTAILRVVERLRGVPMTGFVTEDMRDADQRRIGFCGRTLDGRRFDLARLGGSGPLRVGPYTVDTGGLEAVGVPALRPGPRTTLVVLDEVGKMESFSEVFREAVEELLAGEVTVLATVASHGVGFVKRVRHDPRIETIVMSRASRAAVVGEILRRLEHAGIAATAATRKGAR